MKESSRTYERVYEIKEIKNQDGTSAENPLHMSMEEETNAAKNFNIDRQEDYHLPRFSALQSSREIVKDTTEGIPLDGGVEFGSGAYGWLYNYLLPFALDWNQFDVNFKASKNNKEFTSKRGGDVPKICVGDIYNIPLTHSSVNAIAGLSSWDSIYFF